MRHNVRFIFQLELDVCLVNVQLIVRMKFDRFRFFLPGQPDFDGAIEQRRLQVWMKEQIVAQWNYFCLETSFGGQFLSNRKLNAAWFSRLNSK